MTIWVHTLSMMFIPKSRMNPETGNFETTSYDSLEEAGIILDDCYDCGRRLSADGHCAVCTEGDNRFDRDYGEE